MRKIQFTHVLRVWFAARALTRVAPAANCFFPRCRWSDVAAGPAAKCNGLSHFGDNGPPPFRSPAISRSNDYLKDNDTDASVFLSASSPPISKQDRLADKAGFLRRDFVRSHWESSERRTSSAVFEPTDPGCQSICFIAALLPGRNGTGSELHILWSAGIELDTRRDRGVGNKRELRQRRRAASKLRDQLGPNSRPSGSVLRWAGDLR
jgi:hypothetical protein